jgi:hypothetical protein
MTSPEWLPNQLIKHFCDADVRQLAESAQMTPEKQWTEH